MLVFLGFFKSCLFFFKKVFLKGLFLKMGSKRKFLVKGFGVAVVETLAVVLNGFHGGLIGGVSRRNIS